MNPFFISRFRFWLVLLPVAAGFLIVFARLTYLQHFPPDNWRQIVESNRHRFEVIASRRGNIVDSRGNLLAGTRSLFEVGVDPRHTRPADLQRLPELAELLGRPVQEVEPLFRPGLHPSGREVAWRRLAESVDERTYSAIRSLNISGVYANRRYSRFYPQGELGAHLIGFLNKENTPVMGLEAAMNFWLRGQDGWRESERDGLSRELAHLRRREISPQNGFNLQLTIDSNVQENLEAVIRQIVEEYSPAGVSIIVSDPRNGSILGLANYPSFDPNTFWEFPLETQRNRALTDIFEPGSTFKIVPAAAALNEGLIQLGEGFDCSIEEVVYRGVRIRMPNDVSARGFLTIEQILALSSNRGSAFLGMLLGKEYLYQYSRDFGFGQRSGLGLTGEVSGILHRPNNWDGVMVSRVPIGYAVAATPIQVHQAMTIIASGGIARQLRLVERVFDDNGQTIVPFPARNLRRVVSPEVAQKVSMALNEAVEGQGTARHARIPGYEVAGKTGTARAVVDGRYDHTRHIASFSGFFPASRPEAVITVVIHQPQVSSGVAFGGRLAAPVFNQVAQSLIHHRGIQPAWNDSNLLAESWSQE